MPNPATASPPRPAPKVAHRPRAEAPGELDWEFRSEWVRDAIDVLIAGVLLVVAVIALL
jgi:hypothetical protein